MIIAIYNLPAHFEDVIVFVNVEAVFTYSAKVFPNSTRRSSTTAEGVLHSEPLLEGGHLYEAVELPQHWGMEGDDDFLLHQVDDRLDPAELRAVVRGLEEAEGDCFAEEKTTNKTDEELHCSVLESVSPVVAAVATRLPGVAPHK